MTIEQVQVQLLAVITAITCAIPGVFLVLRRMSLMSDAISHVVLLGIAIGFLYTGNISSPLLVMGAAATGVLMVSLVESLSRTGLVKKDAAIGLVFPALFSGGVILISRNAGNVHLDTDAVLLGELAFAPFNRFTVFNHDLGPRGLWVMGGMLIINLSLLLVFYKELKLATFDPALAAALGFSPVIIHYCLMTIVSITAVGAFDTVGSILVVALMIAPPATAYLLTNRLSRMLLASIAIGTGGALGGYWLAYLTDASIAGSIATMNGLLFGLAFALAPSRGLLAMARRRAGQRMEFALKMLTIHLLHHEGQPEESIENREDHLHEHLRWKSPFITRVVRNAERRNLLQRQESGLLLLTNSGRELAREAVVNP